MKCMMKRLRVLLALGALLGGPGTTAAAAPGAGERVDLIGVRVTDLGGHPHRLGVSRGRVQPAVLVFLDTACPVASRYVPVLNALHGSARAKGVSLYGVLSNPDLSWRESAAFVDDFGVEFPVILDSSGDLALRLGPRVMSESFVVSTANRIVYRGRIDDRFAAVGRLRTRITAHDLREVIEAVAGGDRPEPYETEAVGCFHHVWEAPGEPGTGLEEVSYTRHVAPLLEANCVECHRQGGIAPFSLEGYGNARRWHRMIAYMTGERLMPPWRAVPGFGEFRDERRLSAHQIALLRTWSQSGARLGDPDDAMPAPVRSPSKWRLGEPGPGARDARALRGAGGRRRHLPLLRHPHRLRRRQGRRGARFQPRRSEGGAPRQLPDRLCRAGAGGGCQGRGARVLRVRDRRLPRLQRLGHRRMDAGADPFVLDKGQGMWLPEGGDLVLEVHYHLNGKATSDQSEVAFYFAREPVSHYIDGVVIGTEDLRIPPGETHYWRRFSMNVPAGMTLTDLTPHMHFLGREFIAIATLPDGSERPLIRIADWDFRWQNTFTYREPVHLPAGSRIDAWVRYDNSADNPLNPALEPRTVTWGWETTDEMSELWIGFIPDSPADRERIARASERSWYQPAQVSDSETAELLSRIQILD